MREILTMAARVYRLDPEDQHRWSGNHATIAGGEAPRPGSDPDGEPDPMPFHLALASGGELLVLFREGYEPLAIRVNELVGDWLLAAATGGRRG